MKRRIVLLPLAVLLCLILALTACGNNSAGSGVPASPDTSAAEDISPPAEGTSEGKGTAAPEESLEALLGVDYQAYIVETITMQMGNRMDKNPEVIYFPIEEQKPLTDYVTIDTATAFAVDPEGNVEIILPAGAVTDEANGDQAFTIPKP